MECRDMKEKLSAYLDGALPSEEKKLIKEHLNSCPQCGMALKELKKTEEFVRNLEEVEPPAWLTQKIMARVKAEEEKKRRIFQRLFYPLHIKVPIEALATVLIAVIAVYVFRAAEPEMKSLPVPPAVAPFITKEEAPKPPRESGADYLGARGKDVIQGQPEKDKGTAAPAPPASAMGPRREEKSPPSMPAEETPGGKQKEALAEGQGEAKVAEAWKRQELSESKAASQPPLRKRESLILSGMARDQKQVAAPKAMPTQTIKTAPIEVSVIVKDVRHASSEVEAILGQAGARNINKESQEGKEVLTAELQVQNLQEFVEKLKPIGKIKEKVIIPDSSEGNITIRVDLSSNP